MRYVFSGMAAALYFSVALLAGACGSDEGEKTPISTLHSAIYAGAGSVWTWTLTAEGTFTGVRKDASDTADEDADLVINGTYETLTTGFYRFTVTDADSPSGDEAGNLPPDGSQAFGWAVPGVILVLKPIGEDSEMMVMPVLASTCPSGDLSVNWVSARLADVADISTTDLWGNASIPLAAGSITGAKFYLNGTVEAGETLASHSGCTNGTYTMGGDGGLISMTDAGVGLIASDGAGPSIVALPRDTTVNASSLDGKTFLGLIFSEGDSGGDTVPVRITFGEGGSGTYQIFDDVVAGTTDESGPLTVNEAGTGEKQGFLKLTANPPEDENNPTMWGAVVSNIGGSGRTFLFAAGGNVPDGGGGPVDDAFNVILIEQ